MAPRSYNYQHCSPSDVQTTSSPSHVYNKSPSLSTTLNTVELDSSVNTDIKLQISPTDESSIRVTNEQENKNESTVTLESSS